MKRSATLLLLRMKSAIKRSAPQSTAYVSISCGLGAFATGYVIVTLYPTSDKADAVLKGCLVMALCCWGHGILLLAQLKGYGKKVDDELKNDFVGWWIKVVFVGLISPLALPIVLLLPVRSEGEEEEEKENVESMPLPSRIRRNKWLIVALALVLGAGGIWLVSGDDVPRVPHRVTSLSDLTRLIDEAPTWEALLYDFRDVSVMAIVPDDASWAGWADTSESVLAQLLEDRFRRHGLRVIDWTASHEEPAFAPEFRVKLVVSHIEKPCVGYAYSLLGGLYDVSRVRRNGLSAITPTWTSETRLGFANTDHEFWSELQTKTNRILDEFLTEYDGKDD